jgi:hypothetical protein
VLKFKEKFRRQRVNQMGEMHDFLVFPLIVYQEIQKNQQSAHSFFDNDFKRSLCEHDTEVLLNTFHVLFLPVSLHTENSINCIKCC